MASKFLYSTDGTPENVISSISNVTFRGMTPDQDTTYWEKFETSEALYTNIGVIGGGLIGSSVYSGDFMFSQQGVDVSGNESKNYFNFNPNHIYDSSSQFKPNICMDFNTGQMWAASGNIQFDNKNIILKADNTIIDGNLNITGLALNKKKILNENNINEYIINDDIGDYLDLTKTGGYIELQGNLNSIFGNVYEGKLAWFKLPSFYNSVSTGYSEAFKEFARSFIGCNIIIYNNSNANMHICGSYDICGKFLNEYDGSIYNATLNGVPGGDMCFGYSFYPGMFLTATCKLGFDGVNNKFECVYWEIKCGQFQYIF